VPSATLTLEIDAIAPEVETRIACALVRDGAVEGT
jgi:hypothetical protein